MRQRHGIVPLTAVIALIVASAAVAQPAYEVRTSIVDTASAATYADDTHQFGLSKLRGNYVCPVCGYSAVLPPGNYTCPNPLGLPAAQHPNTTLIPVEDLEQRVLDIAKPQRSAGGMPSCDVAYRDTSIPTGGQTYNDPNQFRAVVGRPFHPNRPGASNAPNGTVFSEFAWPAADPNLTRAHFVTFPPGVSHSRTCATRYTQQNYGDAPELPPSNVPDWAAGTTYNVGDWVKHDLGAGTRYFECRNWHIAIPQGWPFANEPGIGTLWSNFAWTEVFTRPVIVQLGSQKIADEDAYYIRYVSRAANPLVPGEISGWRIWVYSRLYGLEFDSERQPGIAPAGVNYIRIVTASGSLRLVLPVLADPTADATGAVWEISFQTRSNVKTNPPPTMGMDGPALGFGAPILSEAGLNDMPSWERRGVYFTFGADRIVRNTEPVMGDPAAAGNGAPYSIRPGEVGVGKVQMRWQNGVNPWDAGLHTPAMDAIELVHGVNANVRTFWYDDTEWYMDRLNRPTNSAVAQSLPSFASEYEPIESRFLVSRYSVPRSGDADHHGSIETPSGTYPRFLVGASDGTGVVVRPGETSARREFVVRNQLTQNDRYYLCPECGATFTDIQDRGSGFVHALTGGVWQANYRYRPGDRLLGLPWYLCIREHISAANNRPPSGANWNLYWEANGDVYPEDKGVGICPYHGDHGQPDAAHAADLYIAPGPRVGLVTVEAAGSASDTQLARSLTVPEIGTDGSGNPVPWINAFPSLRPSIPDSRVRVGLDNNVVSLGSAAAGYVGTDQYITVSIPPRQTASEPGEAPGNSQDYEANWGYRGTAMTYGQTDARATDFDPAAPASDPHKWEFRRLQTVFDDNDKWDAYYVCPDCGAPLPGWRSGQAYVTNNLVSNSQGRVFICTSNHTATAATEPGIGPDSGSAWNTVVPGPGLAFHCQNPDCPGHEWSPITGAVHAAGTGTCPLTGTPLSTVDPAPNVAGNPNFGFADLAAEEFDAYDIQVSVPKRTQLVAASPATDMGRVASGTGATPDTTVADAGGTPAGRRADPMGTSHWGNFSLRNEGNTIPGIYGTSPGVSGVDDAWYRFFRADAGQNDWGPDPSKKRGYGWVNQRNPIPSSLKEIFHEAVGLLPLSADSATPWLPVMNPEGGASVGAGAMNVGATNIVGTGQLLGRYEMPQLYFMDQNGNGLLDFTRPGVGNVTSARYVFDPDRDVALEPYMAAEAHLRVSESRLPYNDYHSVDTSPTALFTYDANGDPQQLQVMWMTNDPDLGDPDAVPAPNAPMNLVSARANVSGSGINRSYDWLAGPPTALTGLTGPLSQAGPLDVYPYPAGYRSLWVASGGVGGALRSEIHYSDASGTGLIWTGQAKPQGVRGIWDGDIANGGAASGHWTFWHTGIRGQERPMYHVALADGTTRVAVLPVDNSMPAIDPQTTVRTMYDSDAFGPSPASLVTLRRTPHGPFQAVKDISPMLYLPPVVYDTSTGGTATQPMLRVFFAGYARHLGNFDIYEARFNRHDLLTGENNNGKVEFQYVHSGTMGGLPEGLPVLNPSEAQPGPPPGTGPANSPGEGPGEEFTPDELRREFHSRHLDWVTGSNYINNGSPGASFRIGVRQHGTTWEISYYDISWGPADPTRGEQYDETRGVYRVIPRFARHKEDGLFTDLSTLQWPAGPAAPEDGSLPNVRYYPASGPNGEDRYELIDPATYGLPDAEKRPLMMEIDPTLGRVRFSGPLFNAMAPDDQATVFSRAFPALAATIDDVFLAGEYSPFLWRHTLSPADDDCPTAILQSGAWLGNQPAGSYAYPWPLGSHNNRVLLFWRRSYGMGQAPYYGRTSYMMKMQSWTIQVNHPPIVGNLVVRYPSDTTDPQPELYGPGTPEETVGALPAYPGLPPGSYSGHRAEFDADMQNGEIAIWLGVYRWVVYPDGQRRHSPLGPGGQIRVQYDYEYLDDAGNVQTASADEVHTIGDWSQETIVPIDSVLSEGPLRVVEETYRVPSLPVATPDMLVARRYWIFWSSPRPLYDLRDAGDGGSEVRQSSDIYYCTVTPEFPSLVRERLAASNAMDRFRPNLPYP